MKRLIPLCALLMLAGCSTTSNDVTQNLEPLPSGATSWQCDSGNRIIVQPSQDGAVEMLYRGEEIRMTGQSNDSETLLTGAGLTWKVNGLYAELSGTYKEDDTVYTERCTQVLMPEGNE